MKDNEFDEEVSFPARAEGEFDDDSILELRETFEIDGLTYALIGYKKVQLIYAEGHEELTIPESVVYDRVLYEVVAIGAMNDNGLIDYSESITSDAKKVILPESISYIWKYALSLVEEIVYR